MIYRIVLTGGPCGGKTTALNWIDEHFSSRGYKVMIVPEAATTLIGNGLNPGEIKDYQLLQMKLQIQHEEIFLKAAEEIKDKDVLLVHDRGLMDNLAYYDKECFVNDLNSFGLSEISARDNYDAVFHMVTAAKGAETAYTLSNNAARTETIEEAIALDDKIQGCWAGHPHVRIIDNRHDFKLKLKHLVNEVSNFLGQEERYEIEKKFLIEYPDFSYLESLGKCVAVDITQTYMTRKDGIRIRLRKRGIGNDNVYFETIKQTISDTKRIEKERRLSYQEYVQLMAVPGPKKQLKKKRYCLIYESQYFEIDVFSFWNDKAIMEIELDHEDDEIIFPDFIKIIRDVTSEKEYRSVALATPI